MIKLITFFTTGVPALITMLFSYFGRKYSVAVAGLLTLGAMLLVFISCINFLLQSLLGLLVVPAWLLTGVGMFIPGNFAVVLSTLVSARICRAAYDYGWKKTNLVITAH